jgi:hypothetical protein
MQKEDGTAKYAKYAKNPDIFPQSGLLFAYFACFAVPSLFHIGMILESPHSSGVWASQLRIGAHDKNLRFISALNLGGAAAPPYHQRLTHIGFRELRRPQTAATAMS